MRRLALVLAVLGTVLVAGRAPAGARTSVAPAATDCAGSLVGSYPFAGGRAQVDVYYSSATGQNCLRARTVGDYWGRATRIGIAAGVSSQPLPPPDRPTDEPNFCRLWPYAGTGRWAYRDCGPFEYYAGPITFPARDRCIDFLATISFSSGGARPWYEISRRRVHCG